MKLPEENLLYFLEKHSPSLKAWQREMLRIVRNLAQYFYPQRQTKVMNEGCATFVHHTIMNMLYDRGLITEGSMLRIPAQPHRASCSSRNSTTAATTASIPMRSALRMMADIQRICEKPTAEDRDWFPQFAG